ncbi:MAG: DUF5655 domain-containing protein [Acidimicrobiales bacterium]
MSLWSCPDCDRRFGKRNQSHECAPAMDLEEYFSTGPDHERPVFDAIWAHLSTLESDGGDAVHVEPLSVGVFFKGRGTFAQLRPMMRWVALSFNLDRKLTSSRLSRKVIAHGRRFYHVVNIADPAEVDEQIRDWLTEAFFADFGGRT